VSHGKPVECQEDVLNILHCHDFWIVIGVDKVSVIGQPAKSEYQNEND
jgi:hypothetical protein